MWIKKHFGRRKKRVGCLLAILMCAANLASQRGPSKPSFRLLHTFGISGSTDYDGAFPPAQSLTRGADGSIYGAVEGGGGTACGGYGCGFIYRLHLAERRAWGAEIVYRFEGSSDGAYPQGSLAISSSGSLFGTTRGDGGASPATTFQLTPDGEFSVVYNEGGPAPGLALDAQQNIYGAIGLGEFDAGAIAELTPDSGSFWNYTSLYSFHPNTQNGSDGELPEIGPAWDRHGNLYGTTQWGGNYTLCTADSLGCGVVYQLTPNLDGTWTEHILHRFAAYSGDGQSPSSPLILDKDGNVYGTTDLGGAYNLGRVFRLSPSGAADGPWTEAAVYDFPSCSEGCYPGDTLAMDQEGNIYGAAAGGNPTCDSGYTCGVVYKLSPKAHGQWRYTVLHKFSGPDGFAPNGIVLDLKGGIVGTTSMGGANNTGVIFEITP